MRAGGGGEAMLGGTGGGGAGAGGGREVLDAGGGGAGGMPNEPVPANTVDSAPSPPPWIKKMPYAMVPTAKVLVEGRPAARAAGKAVRLAEPGKSQNVTLYTKSCLLAVSPVTYCTVTLR